MHSSRSLGSYYVQAIVLSAVWEGECVPFLQEKSNGTGSGAGPLQGLAFTPGCDPGAPAVYTAPACRWDRQSGCRSRFSPAAPAHLHPEPAQCGPQAGPDSAPGGGAPGDPPQLRTRTERVSLDCKQLPRGERWG